MIRTRPLMIVGMAVAVSGLWLVQAVAAAPMKVRARSAILMDLTDGHVLYEQNADEPIAPASLTKVLTLYLVHEAIEQGRLSPWEHVRVSREAAATGGSRMGLRAGDLVPVEELIKGMAVVSGNDACVAIAEHLAGSTDQFVAMMNRKAAELGMHHSHFVNPNGLPAKGQVTTARDMALLSAAYLKRFPHTLPIHSTQSYTYGRFTHRNANRLLGTCAGVDGLKTGFVCSSGYNITATALRDGHRLVAVVLGASTPGVRAAETARLLNEGYASLGIGTPTLYAAAEATTPAVKKASQARKSATPSSRKQSTKLAAASNQEAPKPAGPESRQSATKPSALQVAKADPKGSKAVASSKQAQASKFKGSSKGKSSPSSASVVTAKSSAKGRQNASGSDSKAVPSAAQKASDKTARASAQASSVSGKNVVTTEPKGSSKGQKTARASVSTASQASKKKTQKAPISAAKAGSSSGAPAGKTPATSGGKT